MLPTKDYLNLSIILMLVFIAKARSESDRHNIAVEHTCHLLDEKFAISSPWTVYPIVYEPINRGRLNIWTGVSTLPTSEFKCYGVGERINSGPQNSSRDHIIMDFASFANELGWTFYDMNKGVTYHGVSVNYCKDVKFKVTIRNKGEDSYSECNFIDKIEQIAGSKEMAPTVQTACQDCTQYLISLINSQITELIKSRLNEQIMDNLYWQLTQLLSNQHFTGPISLSESNSD